MREQINDQFIDDVLLEFFGTKEDSADSSVDASNEENAEEPPTSELVPYSSCHSAHANETCAGCGGIADKHHHYGGRGCHSCRSFFRRYVLSDCIGIKNNSSQNCPSEIVGLSCPLIPKSKKSCRKCRFNR